MSDLTAPQALRDVAAKIINEGKVDEGLCWELDKMYYHSTIRPDGSPKFPHTEFARSRYHTRAEKRKSFEVSAPTGQTSVVQIE